jgi:hypothetical protein
VSDIVFADWKGEKVDVLLSHPKSTDPLEFPITIIEGERRGAQLSALHSDLVFEEPVEMVMTTRNHVAHLKERCKRLEQDVARVSHWFRSETKITNLIDWHKEGVQIFGRLPLFHLDEEPETTGPVQHPNREA